MDSCCEVLQASYDVCVKNNSSKVVKVDFSSTRKPAPRVEPFVWSPQQDAIFDWGAAQRGNLVVRARAGTGKTTTMVEFIRRELERNPRLQVLFAAFNKEIATAAQEKVPAKCEVKTLHGLGLRFVRRNWSVRVEDRDQEGDRAMRLARQAATHLGMEMPEPIARLVAKLHSKARELRPFAQSWEHVADIAYDFDLTPETEWEEEGWSVEKVSDLALAAMQFAKQRTDVIDFSDMVFLPLVHRWVRPWFDMVVVDEAQDMTEPQLLIAQGACRRTGRVVIVGDDRQAIYAFRGADSGSLDRLKQELRATELGLTVTRRCPKAVVALAAQLVPDFTAHDEAPDGAVTRCEADAMLDSAQEGDFILSRTNAPLVPVCMALLRRGVRARIKGRDIGRGIVSLIRKMRCKSVADMPAKLEAYVARETAKADKLSEKARERRVEFVQDQALIVTHLLEGASTIAELETRCNELFSDDAQRAAVMCSTVHRAKGLEATRVFLLEGTFRPSPDIEEQNIRYVAITRAKAQLTWVSGFETQAPQFTNAQPDADA